jgi:hypothetical protein
MNLDLPDSVNRIFEDVKTLTGKDIQLTEKKDLSTYAVVKIARKNMQAHLMYYKPEHSGIINHLIAHECGHILRMYGVPEENRLVPFINDHIRLKALSEIEPEIQKLSKLMPIEPLVKIVNVWYAGIIRQVTSYPSDVMIERWIYDEHPELRPYQSRSLRKQYDEAVRGLSNKVEQMTPQRILIASNSLNCAFFRILGTHFKDSYYLRRYDRSAYSHSGDKLIGLQKDSENNYKGDIGTVDKWADALHLSNWFAWRDFENIPDNYLNTFS